MVRTFHKGNSKCRQSVVRHASAGSRTRGFDDSKNKKSKRPAGAGLERRVDCFVCRRMKSAGQSVWYLSLSGRLDRGRFRGFQTGWHDSANAKPPQGPRTKNQESRTKKAHPKSTNRALALIDVSKGCGFRLLQRCKCEKHDAPCFFWQCASQRGNWGPTNIGCWPLLPSCDLLPSSLCPLRCAGLLAAALAGFANTSK